MKIKLLFILLSLTFLSLVADSSGQDIVIGTASGMVSDVLLSRRGRAAKGLAMLSKLVGDLMHTHNNKDSSFISRDHRKIYAIASFVKAASNMTLPFSRSVSPKTMKTALLLRIIAGFSAWIAKDKEKAQEKREWGIARCLGTWCKTIADCLTGNALTAACALGVAGIDTLTVLEAIDPNWIDHFLKEKDAVEPEGCSICTGEFEEPVKLKCCGKEVCRKCITEWANRDPSTFDEEAKKDQKHTYCPFCRADSLGEFRE